MGSQTRVATQLSRINPPLHELFRVAMDDARGPRSAPTAPGPPCVDNTERSCRGQHGRCR
eukprot:5835314-Pyramimonas_sp.AAC.1